MLALIDSLRTYLSSTVNTVLLPFCGEIKLLIEYDDLIVLCRNCSKFLRSLRFKQRFHLHASTTTSTWSPTRSHTLVRVNFCLSFHSWGGLVAEWLACWTQAQRARVQIAAATLLGNSLRQTVHTHYASVHQAAKLVAAL